MSILEIFAAIDGCIRNAEREAEKLNQLANGLTGEDLEQNVIQHKCRTAQANILRLLKLKAKVLVVNADEPIDLDEEQGLFDIFRRQSVAFMLLFRDDPDAITKDDVAQGDSYALGQAVQRARMEERENHAPAIAVCERLRRDFEQAGHPICPTCEYSFDSGDVEHEPGCELAAYLAPVKGTSTLTWINFAERRPRNRQSCLAYYKLKNRDYMEKLQGRYDSSIEMICGGGVAIGIGCLTEYLFWLPDCSGEPTADQITAATNNR